MPKRVVTDWKEIKRRCETGEGYGTVAKAFGVARSTISSRAAKEGWKIPHANSNNLAPTKGLKIVKPTDNLLHQDQDTDSTRQKIDGVAEKWNVARKGHKKTIQDQMKLIDDFSRVVEQVIGTISPSKTEMAYLKTLAQIIKDIGTVKVSTVASERQIFAEEIETIRAQQKNEEKLTDAQLEGVDGLFLVRDDESEAV